MFKKYIILLIIIGMFFESVYGYNDAANCSAQGAAVVECSTGALLYGKNADKKLGMASTTKIMTAICAIEHGDLEEITTVSPKAAAVEGSSMYLEAGEKIKLSELVKGLLLVSGNDAATAIAEAVSGSEGGFVLLMNQKANEIGVKNTCFQNPHGLAVDGHFTTAYDLALIGAYAMKNPVFEKIASTKSDIAVSVNGKQHFLTNHNKLLKMYDGCNGIKTGFTKATGRCLVTSAERNGLKLVCVTLNDGADWQDHISMFDRAYSEYEAVKLLSAGKTVGQAYVTGGVKKKVRLEAEYDIFVPVKKGEKPMLALRYNEKLYLKAPIKKGESRVKAEILSDDKKIGEIYLVASENSEMKKGKEKTIRIKENLFKRLFK